MARVNRASTNGSGASPSPPGPASEGSLIDRHQVAVRQQPARLARRVAHFDGHARRRQPGFGESRLHAAPRRPATPGPAHPALYPALLRLQGLRLRQVFNVVEDMASLGLRARLGRQLRQLSHAHGVPCRGGEVRIGVRLRQDVLAEMVGCSRQRVDQHLAELTRAHVIRREAGALVVRDPAVLQQWARRAAAA